MALRFPSRLLVNAHRHTRLFRTMIPTITNISRPISTNNKPLHKCSECGFEQTKWSGFCSSCNAVNTMVETVRKPITVSPIHAAPFKPPSTWLTGLHDDDEDDNDMNNTNKPAYLPTAISLSTRNNNNNNDVDKTQSSTSRYPLRSTELSRVFGGGGIVRGSLTLLSGAPGIGKSTLVLQLSAELSLAQTENNNDHNKKVLYVAAEEAWENVRDRSARLSTHDFSNIDVVNENDLNEILPSLGAYHAIVVDSISTVHMGAHLGEAGGVTQMKACALALSQAAKAFKIPIILVAHQTKAGELAGPRTVEHLVDVVVSLEADAGDFRFLTCSKNRFAPIEVGFFQMTKIGLVDVSEKNSAFVGELSEGEGVGVCRTLLNPNGGTMGSRFLCVETQILLNPVPPILVHGKIKVSGFSMDRLQVLLAVLHRNVPHWCKALGHRNDIFCNVVGGLKCGDDRGADLAVAVAIASAAAEQRVMWPVTQDGHHHRAGSAFIGEVGLTGDVRAPRDTMARVKAAEELGLHTVVVPKSWLVTTGGDLASTTTRLLGVRHVAEAVEICLEETPAMVWPPIKQKVATAARTSARTTTRSNNNTPVM